MITQKEVIDLKRRAVDAGIKASTVDSILKGWGTERGASILEHTISDRMLSRKEAKQVNRSPLSGLSTRTKGTDVLSLPDAIAALNQALGTPAPLADQLSRKFSPQQQYELLRDAAISGGHTLSFTVEVKSRKSGPLDFLHLEKE